MKRLIIGILLAASAAMAQDQGGPAAYQPIRVKFRVMDLDGRPFEGVTVSARLDSGSTRVPPDKVLKAKSGVDEFTYIVGEQNSPIFSTQQQTGPDGVCEVPFIVYSNRTDPIDYELGGLYKQPNRDILVRADGHQSFTNGDDNRLIVLHANIRRDITPSIWLMSLACWLGASTMGFLLFYKGFYRYWLSKGKTVEHSRALCTTGTIFVSLLAMGTLYWWLLPHYVSLWLFFGMLFVIWLFFLIISILTQKRRGQ
jgi:hypothetical protein